MENLDEMVKKNFEMFEKIEKEHSEYLSEKDKLLKRAKELGVDFKMQIPWNKLTEEQKKELERIKLEGERDLKSALIKKTHAPSGRGKSWMKI